MEKDLNYKSDVIEFTPKQILAGKIIAILITVLLCVWYALVGFGVINIPFWRIFLGSLLGAIGLILLLSGVVQVNSVSVWLAFPFLIPALIEFFCVFGISCYQYLYPLYVAIPAISSLACVTFSSGKITHLKVIVFFLLEALFYLLASLGICEIFVSVILSVALFVGAIVYVSIKIFRSSNFDE
jgi:hypothetical protein